MPENEGPREADIKKLPPAGPPELGPIKNAPLAEGAQRSSRIIRHSHTDPHGRIEHGLERALMPAAAERLTADMLSHKVQNAIEEGDGYTGTFAGRVTKMENNAKSEGKTNLERAKKIHDRLIDEQAHAYECIDDALAAIDAALAGETDNLIILKYTRRRAELERLRTAIEELVVPDLPTPSGSAEQL